MYGVDPLGIPFLQKALGQGQLTEKDLQEALQKLGGPFGQGMQMGMGGGAQGGGGAPMLSGLGMGPQAPAPNMPPITQHGSSGRGMNPLLVGQMLGNQGGGQATQGPNGDWIPGPEGFPAATSAGNSPLAGAAQMFAGK